MDKQDGQKFIDALYCAFPGIREYFERMSPDLAVTHKNWLQTLSGCSLLECLHVVDTWLTGKRPAPTYQETTQIALVIKACVGFDRAMMARQAKPVRYDRSEIRPDALSIGPAALRCIDAAAEGATEYELEQILEEELAKFPVSAESQRPVDCWKCSDRGTRMVWRPDEIDKIRAGKIARGAKLHYCATACDCNAGAKYSQRSGKLAGLQVFVMGYHCEIDADPFDFASRQTTTATQWVG